MRILLCAIVVVGCTSSAGGGAGGDGDNRLEPMPFAAWKAAHPCPPDARLDVRQDDTGTRAYCLLSTDGKQGPFAAWEASGQQSRGGIFEHDQQQLLLTWDERGKIMTREVRRTDGKTDMTIWDKAGKPSTRIED